GKNRDPVRDFETGATLNTRPVANSYANRLTIGMQATVNASQFDDLLWRSDASSVPWVGDIRCFTRMPASDGSTQFARSPATLTQTPFSGATLQSTVSTWSFYTP